MNEKINIELLDEVQGEEALAWVNSHNSRTLSTLGTKRFLDIEEQIKNVLDDPDRIPYASIRGDFAYNFWVDEKNPRGLWRRQPASAYLQGADDWSVLLDIDELAKSEGKAWVFHGASLLFPEYSRALIALSDGGCDADVIREFDVDTCTFVEDGFNLPDSKGECSWITADQILVSRDFGPDTMTDSGYPRQVRLWKRGQDLEDAQIIFEGEKSDVGVFPHFDSTPGWQRVMISRLITFYESETFIADPTAQYVLKKVEVPTHVEAGPWRDWMLMRPKKEWTVGDKTFKAGSLVATQFDNAFDEDFEAHSLFTPTDISALEDVTTTRHHVVVNVLHHVSNRLGILTPPTTEHTGWDRRDLKLATGGNGQVPAHATLQVSAVDSRISDQLWLHATGFTTPMTLSLLELSKSGETLSATTVRKAPRAFNAQNVEVSQHFASSADGTKVPYFQISTPGTEPAPTLLYGYGGFEVSLTPSYLGTAGPAWVERGGTYVVANIRGGGEYGPKWHQAALQANRHRAYEDFVAVADDLVARGVTTKQQLGARGGSNGGLLMGMMLTKYPEHFGAIVCEVPLLDMSRFHTLLAGASWMAEYGDPSDPKQWEFIKTFSPYHLFQPGQQYPPVLFTTSTRDDRVHPAHARTMVAKMDEAGADVLFYENIEGGHAGAADNKQRAKMSALAWEFLWQHLGGE